MTPETQSSQEDHRLQALERENRLLQESVRQLGRLQRRWSQSLDELKLTKSQLQASNRFLEQLLQTAPLPILVVSPADGRIVMANGAAERLMGVNVHELDGRSVYSLLDETSRRRALRGGRGGATGLLPRPGSEMRVITAAGESRVLEVSWSQAADPSGQAENLVVIARDITERREARQRLRLAGAIIETSPEGIVVIDDHQTIVDANAACARMSAVRIDKLIGQSATVLLDPCAAPSFLENVVWPSAKDEGLWQGETAFVRADGSTYPVWLTVTSLEHPEDRVSRYIFLFTDITQRKNAEIRLRHLSLHDSLTGLPNRVLFRERLEQALGLARRERLKVATLVLDLDGFKDINDTLGHHAGDELLRQVAGRLREAVRASDTVARFGGDEFSAIVFGMERSRDVETVARKLLENVSRPYLLGDESRILTTSIGISVYPDDGQDIESLMKFADMAMYRAKQQGKNAYRFFTTDMNAATGRRASLMGRMQGALERGEFTIHYQPAMDLKTGRYCAVEALPCWRHPDLGLVSAEQFVPLAEENGFITTLGERMLHLACRQVMSWRTRGLGDLSLAMNLSVGQFRCSGLANMLAKVLDETGLAPANLDLEFTEAIFIDRIDVADRVLSRVGDLGVNIVLDDFGAGHASIASLKRLPFSRVKIDRRFIGALHEGSGDAAITDAIIRMAGALGLTVSADGVETRHQADYLSSRGCDRAQGAFYAHPLAAEDCWALLEQGITNPEALRSQA